MQEEITTRTVALVMDTEKLTARTLKEAMEKALRQMQQERGGNRARDAPHGKQSVKSLLCHGEATSHVELPDNMAGSFGKIARKYDVDYAIEKIKDGGKTKYIAFFRAKDADVLNAAFAAYTAKAEKQTKRPSIRERLARTVPEKEPEKTVEVGKEAAR